MKISVLGIGTELTTGQILNRNAQWISKKLSSVGLPTSAHLVVPDDKTLILDSLKFLSLNSDILFVTGGLGPTTDDFTRDVIAEFTRSKMVFDEASQKHIEERLKSRGVPFREAQKQQCYFPENSEILFNRMGTANAFVLKHEDQEIYVLPGPPREIEAIWQDHIEKRITKKISGANLYKTLIWQTLGLGESEIAHLAETTLMGCDLEKGYRAHLPFVEVKLSYYVSNEKDALVWADKLTKVLEPYTVARNDDDSAEQLVKKFDTFRSISICDTASGSFLLSRLTPVFKNLLNDKKFSFSSSETALAPADLELSLLMNDDFSATISFKTKDKKKGETFASPYSGTLLKERSPHYFTERALLYWLREL